MNKNRQSGFTLVELIVVIAILGILAGVGTVAYTGYVEKAQEAADQQLLGAVNLAFASACIDSGVDMNTISGGSVAVDDNQKVGDASATGVSDSSFNTNFHAYLGAENTKFNRYDKLYFVRDTHLFIGLLPEEYGYAGSVLKLDAETVKKLKDSTFGDESKNLGADKLMQKVDYVTGFATALLDGNESNAFADIIGSEEYGRILASNLGIDLDADGGEAQFAQTVGVMLNKSMDNLVAMGTFASDASREEGSDLWDAAYNQLVANNAVLYAAQNSDKVSNNILSVLGAKNSKSSIVNTVNSDSGAGLSQAAMAYGLYTAYAYANDNGSNGLIEKTNNPMEVLSAIDSDQGFKDYIRSNQAQKDLDGYLAAMSMVNTNIESNPDAVSDILVNGFANDDLVALLKQAMG